MVNFRLMLGWDFPVFNSRNEVESVFYPTYMCSQGRQSLRDPRIRPERSLAGPDGWRAEESHRDCVRQNLSTAETHHRGGLPETGAHTHAYRYFSHIPKCIHTVNNAHDRLYNSLWNPNVILQCLYYRMEMDFLSTEMFLWVLRVPLWLWPVMEWTTLPL